VADREADVVPRDRRGEPDDPDQPYVEAAGAGVDRRQDQGGLPGDGNPEVLEQDQPRDGQVAVVVERRLQAVENPRQVGRGGRKEDGARLPASARAASETRIIRRQTFC
jgi:hypothetical protein